MDTYKKAQKSAKFLKKYFKNIPDTLIVLGTGFGDFAKNLDQKNKISYKKIPYFAKSSAPNHKGILYSSKIGEKGVMIMCGRLHYYEGYSAADTAFPILVMALCGIKNVILTNAAGGINESFNVSDIVVIDDHIKLSSNSSVFSLNNIGNYFFDMTNAYDKDLKEKAKKVIKDMGLEYKSGVYAYMAGPQFETPAEIRALKSMGADLVGMSTVYECIMARKMGLKVLGISIVSNMAAGISKKVSGQDVDKAMAQSEEKIKKFLTNVVS